MKNFRQFVTEYHPLRETDPQVTRWIDKVLRRPDLDQLYLHGSPKQFDHFEDPKTEWGKLIHFTKISEYVHPHRPFSSSRPFQAEYYGNHLYLCTLDIKQPFKPWKDAKAKQIMIDALPKNRYTEADIEIGRLDYQNCPEVVPPAVRQGYDEFTVFEVSVTGNSHGVTHGRMVTIVDRYPHV